MGKRIARISRAIFGADQSTIDKWFMDLDREIVLAQRQNKVKQKLFEAINKGVEPSKIAEITGIPIKTIYTWIQKTKKQPTLPEASDYIKEAKELKESMEKPQSAKT